MPDNSEEEARKAAFIADSHRLAKEFSEPGTLKNFMIRQGFLPDNEAKAEALMKSIIDNEYKLEQKVEELERELAYVKRVTNYTPGKYD